MSAKLIINTETLPILFIFQKEMMVSPDFEQPRSPRSFLYAMESCLRSCGDLQVSLRRIGICLSIWGLWGNFFWDYLRYVKKNLYIWRHFMRKSINNLNHTILFINEIYAISLAGFAIGRHERDRQGAGFN